MKTQKVIFSLVVLLALFLAACTSQATPTAVMAEKDANAAEGMDEKEDAMMDDQMMSDKGDEAMADKDEEIMSADDDAMMDDQMMEEKDDQMMSDEGDEAMADKGEEMMSADDDAMMDDHDDEMMSEEDNSMMEEKDDDMAEDNIAPDWFKISLTDARTGETFTIDDFKGKVVLVETLAMWCSNCLKQQGEVLALHDLVGERDDFVSLGVDIDPNEDAAALSSYTTENGFRWLYTVAPPEVAREIAQLYGDQYLNPPSTPMLIIDREGEVHLLPFGIKSAESLLEALQPFLDAEM